MKKFICYKVFLVLLIALSFTGCNQSADKSNSSSSFIEPKTNEEWKAFCEAPDSRERIKAIEDKEKRGDVAGVCLRTPWKKFETVPDNKKLWQF
ncbi:hypothetical protein [Methyloglobulus sp.]|uniref:hypothetical protein n=1 Tax=Methyloglobulus sp. TaxID=2518622 RepID=UPI0032B785C5